ncbi:MAG: group III truncated hemoglobin [Catalinimonas sp.]
MPTDITTETDVRHVLGNFRERLGRDALLAHHFRYVNWNTDLPPMQQFWSDLLLHKDEHEPRGRPFPRHMSMIGLDEYHFDRWVALFADTIDTAFRGRRAERMKHHVGQLARAVQSQLNVMSADD